ncbi:MAG: DUF366 family protein [bacterium]
MKAMWLEEQIDYSGKELRPHWCFEKTGIIGDVIVGFIGGCRVECNDLVDLVDRREGSIIAGEKMLHFICEIFGIPLIGVVFAQRLLCSIVKDRINQTVGDSPVVRKGDDLFVADGKLSVSIATISPVSGLIHLGLNIDLKGVPVRAACLEDLRIDAASLAADVMSCFCDEVDDCIMATKKVRPVI